MIIARAPLRVSLGGGGTDLAAYYLESGGFVLSVTIDSYIYVTVAPARGGVHVTSPDGAVRGAQVESLTSQDVGARLPLLVAEHCAPGESLRIFIAGEVPSGTGLGSSSALTVALVTACGAYMGVKRSPAEIAALACELEIDQLGSPIGKQDQYASAIGGVNGFTFGKDHSVLVQPLELRENVRASLERKLMLLFTGRRRDAGSILAHQRRQSEDGDRRTLDALDAIKNLALTMVETLKSGDLPAFGTLLHESWEHKRRVTSGITTGYIDHCYDTARSAGAVGGKITGAGGGGFLLLYADEDRQPAVLDALRPLGLTPLQFSFTSRGAEVILDDPSLDAEQWRR